MRVVLWVQILIWQAFMVQATPVPPPPDGFSAEQYIDLQGCVYVKVGASWVARKDKAGQRFCGFPPSLSVRRTDPETLAVLPSQRKPTAMDAEAVLLESLAEGLRQGEFAADPRQPERRLDAGPQAGPGSFATEIAALIRSESTIQAKMSASLGDDDLCARLGYHFKPQIKPVPGADVTRGLCHGMTYDPTFSLSDVPRVQRDTMPAESTRTDKLTATEGADDLPDKARRRGKRPAEARKKKGNITNKVQQINRGIVSDLERIPAAARYVELGQYNHKDARELANRLHGFGFPVVQAGSLENERTKKLIMAGPFKTRQALIVALNHLRANGFATANAR